MQNIDYLFKVVLVGSQSVGKSALMAQFVDKIFTDSYLSTIGVDFKIKTLHIDDKTWVKLQIWDTAGQERFTALTQSHFRGAHGCVCVYDVSLPRSFDDAMRYLRIVIEENGLNPDACYLVANKIDLNQREVTTQQGQEGAQQLQVNYIEVSAKKDINVQTLFESLTREMLKLVDQKKLVPTVPDNQNNRLVQRNYEDLNKKSGCC